MKLLIMQSSPAFNHFLYVRNNNNNNNNNNDYYDDNNNKIKGKFVPVFNLAPRYEDT
jgi:hypothetical protein